MKAEKRRKRLRKAPKPQQLAMAPAPVIGSSTPAPAPRAHEDTIRLADLLPKKIRGDADLYSFLYFMIDGGDDDGAQTFYASPDALVSADARLCTWTGDKGVVYAMALPKVCGGSGGGGGTCEGQGECEEGARLPAIATSHGDLFDAAPGIPASASSFASAASATPATRGAVDGSGKRSGKAGNAAAAAAVDTPYLLNSDERDRLRTLAENMTHDGYDAASASDECNRVECSVCMGRSGSAELYAYPLEETGEVCGVCKPCLPVLAAQMRIVAANLQGDAHNG